MQTKLPLQGVGGHYSFDLWLTLIKSNPLFKEQRARFFHSEYNFQRKSLDEVTLIFRQVDLLGNAINERTGKNIDADELYLMVISMMNNYDIIRVEIDLDGLFIKMESLLFDYMPMLYSDETSDVLHRLKEQSQATFSILSNTGFIRGQSLRRVLAELKIADLFDFQLYSDETGLSKPNKELFELMLKEITTLKKQEIDLKSIVHIGDNPVADIAGGMAIGIETLLINSNQKSISTLLS